MAIHFFESAIGQTATPDSQYTTVIAGKQYAISEARQKKWGQHYRKEWNEPVKVRIAMLDTLAGGLIPYQEGGGRQSKTLRLRDANGREYVLRSIDKTFGRALPDIARGTFLESIADDQASIGHPYAAVTIPQMSRAAGIYHTRPQVLYIPKQKQLGKFNDEYGNTLYLFEQRPDENWETAENFGNAKKIIGTEKLFEKLQEDNDRKVDQLAYVSARLYDMMIGDWGRHEDQWRWAEFKDDDDVLYKPIPRDRDQVYTKFDGSRVKLIFSLAGLDHLQSFDYNIEDVTTYNFPARNLDRRLANEVTQDQWLSIAKDLQQKLTDTIISSAVREMPAEVFPYSGEEIIAKLKSRRDKLQEFAKEYYLFLAKEVDVPGTHKKEMFEIDVTDNGNVTVRMYKIKKDGTRAKKPLYTREFLPSETDEIRVYGMDDDDMFIIKGKIEDGLIRIIPGKGKDSIDDGNIADTRKNIIHVYDDRDAKFSLSESSRLHRSNDTLKNEYQYKHFEYNDNGFVFRPGLTIGVGYHITTQGWRRTPFASEHRWMAYYGPNRGSLAFEYRYIVTELIGRWNGEGILRADMPLVSNFFGLGNESMWIQEVNRKFYRYRTTRFSAGMDLYRLFDSAHLVKFGLLFNTMDIRNDEDRFITKDVSGIPPSALGQKYYGTVGISYQYKKSDHPIVPTKGVEFNLSAAHIQNMEDISGAIGSFSTSASVYLPFLKKLSFAVRVGGARVNGDPEFYQMAILSGKENLRGYRRQRFYGQTSFYNNNELRLILDTRNHFFSGKIGLLAFMDNGRVWLPGEDSDKWHFSYGGGFFVAPFNRILLNTTVGFSEEDRVVHIRIGFLF